MADRHIYRLAMFSVSVVLHFTPPNMVRGLSYAEDCSGYEVLGDGDANNCLKCLSAAVHDSVDCRYRAGEGWRSPKSVVCTA